MSRLGALAAATVLCVVAVAGCTSDHERSTPTRSSKPSAADTTSMAEARVRLETILDAGGIPTGLAFRAHDAARYVVVREGRVLRIDASARRRTMLDLSDRVTLDGEGGAFDLAFTADGAQLLVSWAEAATGDLVVSRFDIDRSGERTSKPEEVVRIGDGDGVHHAGSLERSGSDLLVGVGDGGELNAVAGQMRLPDSLRGRILRYAGLGRSDAPTPTPTTAASGLRNPWRFFTDPLTHRTWIGDVGQARWEEVDVADLTGGSAPDFGWDLLEGDERSRGLPPDGVTYPAAVAPHRHGRCAIVGGPVVRDRTQPDLVGAVVVGDYCASKLTFLRFDRHGLAEERELTLPKGATAVSFAVGPDQAIYVLRSDHVISRLDPGKARLQVGSNFRRTAAPTFDGDASVCGVTAAIAAYPAMAGKPPTVVRSLATDLRAALAAYRAAPLPDAARAPFDRLEQGLVRYLDALEAAGWDTTSPEVAFGARFIAEGAKDYAALVAAEADACDGG